MPVDFRNEYFGLEENTVPVNLPPGYEVFGFLQRPEVLIRMFSYTKNHLPALTGVVEELERDYGGNPNFDLANRRHRQTVGRMICWLMKRFGYTVINGRYDTRNRLRDFSGARLFSVSAIYEKKDGRIAPYTLGITVELRRH
jgi:hypothetical protein